MFKKWSLLIILAVFIFLTSGCATVVKGGSGLAQGVSDGMKEDWTWAKKTDAWLRDNLW